ncbi:hypothetical protein ABZ721_15215 [Streptomyces sp. NPDC006733]|uniref:hypothetical protein n=1 Tax=Streptomyces sp. NPDC006733 TaxID=3155460 RepID=UPI0033E1A1D9
MFDAIDAHPWLGAHLSRTPSPVAMPQLFEGFGGPLPALGVPEQAQFDSASALVGYTLGGAGQNAANTRLLPPGMTGKGPAHGLGLVGMRERVALLSGDLSAGASRGGFRVTARLPLPVPAGVAVKARWPPLQYASFSPTTSHWYGPACAWSRPTTPTWRSSEKQQSVPRRSHWSGTSAPTSW